MTQDELFDQLKHPNPHLRERAMWELADLKDETTIPRLMANLGEEDVVYRRASVKALGVIGTETVEPLVTVLLGDDDVTTRASALKALTQVVVRHPETPMPQIGMDALKTSLDDANPVVYVASVMTLGEIGTPAFDILAEALKTTDNEALAVAIVNAMPSIGDDRAKDLLESYVAEEGAEESYSQEVAKSALSRLSLIQNNQPPS